MGTAPVTVPSPAQGRPRDPSRDAAIRDATLALVAEQGFGLSIEEVARRAGVAKTTIYRRYPSKEELVIAALETLVAPRLVPDTGSVRADLLEYARWRLESIAAVSVPLLAVRLLNDLRRSPELRAIFTERIAVPARAPLHAIIARGIARGELRDDLDPDVMVDVLVGGPAYRMLVGGDVTPVADQVEAYLDAVLGGIARQERGQR